MSTPAASPLLQVRNLATGYEDIRVVWDVSFDVLPGQVSAILGRNGAGKTTTLRAVAGLNRVAAGTITFQGTDITGEPTARRVRRGIGLVQEGKRVFRRRTIEENLLLGGYILGGTRSRVRTHLDGVYDLFPVLRDRAQTPAGALSGGQQQMLAIAQALVARPSLLLLDEPSGGLAPAIVQEVMDTVTTLKQTGIGILLVEQAVEAAVSVADHVTVIDVGRVVMDRPAGEVDDLEVLRDAYFGRAAT